MTGRRYATDIADYKKRVAGAVSVLYKVKQSHKWERLFMEVEDIIAEAYEAGYKEGRLDMMNKAIDNCAVHNSDMEPATLTELHNR